MDVKIKSKWYFTPVRCHLSEREKITNSAKEVLSRESFYTVSQDMGTTVSGYCSVKNSRVLP